MTRKDVTLDAAEFLDSGRARELEGLDRGDLRRVVEALLEACYDELGTAPHRLDGEQAAHLLREALPGRLRPRDPAADELPALLDAFLAHLEETRVVEHAFELRRAFAENEEALLEAVRSGSAAPRAGRPSAPVVHRAEKLGRNDPCFCGSGKKFKKCCGRQA